jgi:urease subunit beta
VNDFFVPEEVVPGEVVLGDGPIVINAGRETRTITVSNIGDRPIQVGSHFHFADTNPFLSFDRSVAQGFRLDVAAGTAVRFEPGVTREVVLVALAGARRIPGLQIRIPSEGETTHG